MANVSTRTTSSERSPRSGTQAMQGKADRNPTDMETGQPTCKVKSADALKFAVAASQVLVSSALQFVVSGAVCYVIHAMEGGKREDIADQLGKLVSETNVKKSMSYALLASSAKLATKIAGTGTSALSDAASIRGSIQTADSPDEACAAVIGLLKNDHKVDSFNKLNVLLGIEQTWNKAAQDAARKAEADRTSASGKAKRTRQADKRIVDGLADKPSRLTRGLVVVAGTNSDAAIEAIVAGINRLEKPTMIESIMQACSKRLKELRGEPATKAEPQQNEPAPAQANAA